MKTLLLVLITSLMGCSESFTPDSGHDAYFSTVDASMALDAGADLEDSGTDAGQDAYVALEDAGVDSGVDGGTDAGYDAGVDAGRDSGATDSSVVLVDAGVDAAPIWSTEHACGNVFSNPELETLCPAQRRGWYYRGVFQCCASCTGFTPLCQTTPEYGEGWYVIPGRGCGSNGWVNNAECM